MVVRVLCHAGGALLFTNWKSYLQFEKIKSKNGYVQLEKIKTKKESYVQFQK